MKKNSKSKKLRPFAFTLVELLVVISIIALLVSILMPALGRAREIAKRTVCRANVRAISQTNLLYINDHDGHLPWMEPGDRAWTEALSVFSLTNTENARYYPIHSYFAESAQVLHCPSNQKWPMEEGDPIDIDGGMPNSLRNSYEWWRYSGKNGTYTNYQSKSLSSVKSPSQQFVAFDYSPGPLSSTGEMVVSYYHNGEGASVGYVDGHASWVFPGELWEDGIGYWVFPPRSPSWP